MNRGVRVELVHQIHQLGLRRVGWQSDGTTVHARLDARALLGTNVDLACRIVTYENDRESGRDAPLHEPANIASHFLADALRDCLSVNQLSAQSPQPSFRVSPRP